jgi:hypothetical protein
MRKIIAIIMFILLCFGSAHAYVTELKPLDQLITTPMGKVKPRKQHLLPAITWAADQVAINANGSAWETQPGSIFDQHGLNFKILWLDTFQKMVEMFIAGEIWMLRANSTRQFSQHQSAPGIRKQHWLDFGSTPFQRVAIASL